MPGDNPEAYNQIVLTLIAGWLSACGRIQPRPADNSAGLTIDMAVEPEQPVVGGATLIVTLTDESGRPVNEASVNIEGNMTHAGMTPVFGEATAGNNGRYEIPFEWTMGGDWIVTVNITLPDGENCPETFRFQFRAKGARRIAG